MVHHRWRHHSPQVAPGMQGLVLVQALVVVVGQEACPGGQWRWPETTETTHLHLLLLRCGSGECIVVELQCNGRRECSDGSDEGEEQVGGMVLGNLTSVPSAVRGSAAPTSSPAAPPASASPTPR